MKRPQSGKVQARRTAEPVAPFPEHGHVCLNCGQDVSNNYCSMCGQSTHTHRLSIRHFALHDLVHSIWHVDRGIFFTLKEVLIRPGYAALEYIRGKRAGKFPILTLLLILIGVALWLYSKGASAAAHSGPRVTGTGSGTEFVEQIFEFIRHNRKWLLLGLIPVGSISTLIIFRRTCLNYTEHLVVNCYVFGGLLVLLILIKLLMLAWPGAADVIGSYNVRIGFLFYLFGYWQAYHKPYKILGLVWRYAMLTLLNAFILLAVVIMVLIGTVLTHPDIMHINRANLQATDSVVH